LGVIDMELKLDARADVLAAARLAHGRRDWHSSYGAFTRASEIGPLDTDDLDAMAAAAWRLGHAKESVRIAELVFTRLARKDPAAAAMKAAEVSLAWFLRGDLNIGVAWMSRARRLLDDAVASAVHGYVAYLGTIHAVMQRDFDDLPVRVRELRAVADRLDDPAVTALALVGQGLEAILGGRVSDGYALIDEAMLPVLADQVPIEWAGDIYCIVLHHCHQVADLPRMRTWTQSMAQWCDLAGSIPYGGVCEVHRLQLQDGTADYRQIEDRLLTVSNSLVPVNSWAAAEGFYQLGEVRRLLGDFDGALAAFAKVRGLGMEPQPGEALLRCRQGDKQAAWTGLRVALVGQLGIDRMRLLRGAVHVALARDDLDEAESHCRELEAGALVFNTPGFKAWTAHARGALLVRRGSHGDALTVLESALREYRSQQCRYEIAEVYEWMALAHRGLGDHDTAAADAATAENIYDQLGVEPAGICDGGTPGRLTKRELDIIRRIAVGASNREVAKQLSISEKTVSRHLANIYAKLDVSSRTAAVAWAHQNNVL
jgi:DNA-binding CsgD family transcriptional regulator